MSVFINNYDGSRATDKGTPIMKPGQDMNKNAFLTILSAELSNLDPTGNVDSTQYVTQMAQFATMEQMANLNTTMVNNAHQDLVGKGVTMKIPDKNGMPYTGVVKSVTTNSSGATISVEVNVDGKNEYKDFDVKDIYTVIDVPDYSIPPLTNMNGNMSFLVASSFIGKNVELNEKNEEGKLITGEVLSVSKENGMINVKVKIDGTDEIKDFSYDKVIKVTSKDSTEDKPTEDKPTEE